MDQDLLTFNCNTSEAEEDQVTMARRRENRSPQMPTEKEETVELAIPEKVKPPKFNSNSNFHQFTLRFLDWSYLTNKRPHYLMFLSLILDDSTYNKLHAINIHTIIQNIPEQYIAIYAKAILPSQNETQQKLLNIRQSSDENVEQYGERVQLLMEQCSNNADINSTLGYNAFISGIKDKSVKLKLYESGIASFHEILLKAKQLETANSIISQTSQENDEPVVFAALTLSTPEHPNIDRANTEIPPRNLNRTEQRSDRTCWNCYEPGHIARFCTVQPQQQYTPRHNTYSNPHSFRQNYYRPNTYNTYQPRQYGYQPRPRFQQNRQPRPQQFFRAQGGRPAFNRYNDSSY